MDDRLDDQLSAAARDYHEPPETPRAAMWERIVAERAERAQKPAKEESEQPEGGRVLPFRHLRHLGPLSWAAGIAAILLLGIGLGRLSVSPTSPTIPAQPLASQPTPRVNAAAYEMATTEYLSQSEAFLTLFRASIRQNTGNEQLAAATARQLLSTNRLMLDSPAAQDSKTKLLLQDLELVLAQIAQLSPDSRNRDLDLITEGLERAGVMTRLRTAVPSGPSTTQGAL
ncbi:MAG TPA: hypothetical protein VE282_04540 [Gemmatimonadales bacterium]|nr:hypothetical protein [Gemmatimonadales bacterium]